jgi:DNA-binding NtrC family response regulator
VARLSIGKACRGEASARPYNFLIERPSDTELAGLRVLIVDDEESIRFGLRKLLDQRGAESEGASTLSEALAAVDLFHPDAVLLDLKLPDSEGLSGLARIRAARPEARVVMMTGFGTIETAVEAVKTGAENFFTKPVAPEHLFRVLARIAESLRLEAENRALRREVEESDAELFWGSSDSVRDLLAQARRVAKSDALLVLTGESGTGKGALARQIHRWSLRSKAPFVNVNCAGLSRDLMESELFGHEKGSFTGAASAKPGLFELAHRGTLFLDEVAEIDLSLQPRILKAIEEKRFHRVGGIAERAVDCRVIAASNRHLKDEVAAGRFRQDLYFRLNVLELCLPPLRGRAPDAPLLAGEFLAEFDAKVGRARRAFTQSAQRILAAYSWPGNVREVRNFAERVSILSSEDAIGSEEVTRLLGVPQDAGRGPLPTLEQKEREYVAQVLRLTGGNKSAAAEILGITRATLYAKIKDDDSDAPQER